MTSHNKKCKSRYCQDILRETADSPDKFWAAIKKLYSMKLLSEQGSAFQIDGKKSTDKKFISNSFFNFYTDNEQQTEKKVILAFDLIAQLNRQ